MTYVQDGGTLTEWDVSLELQLSDTSMVVTAFVAAVSHDTAVALAAHRIAREVPSARIKTVLTVTTRGPA